MDSGIENKAVVRVAEWKLHIRKRQLIWAS